MAFVLFQSFVTITTTHLSGNDTAPVRIAIVTDTHYWPRSSARDLWTAAADAAGERDGLLVGQSDVVLAAILEAFGEFKRGGGAFALHLGDVGCGGSFPAPLAEFDASLAAMRSAEAMALGHWAVIHAMGNHDLDPGATGGVGSWLAHFGQPPVMETDETGIQTSLETTTRRAYHAVELGARWRLLVLDAMDGVQVDRDGHGHVGIVQLHWLEGQLRYASAHAEKVVLAMHQLLIHPSAQSRAADRKRAPSAWLGPTMPDGEDWFGEGDFIDNRAEVLSVIARHPGVVKASLHGHVHANTLAWQHGATFVSLASSTEYPMQWHELQVLPCELRLLSHPLALPALRQKSAARDTRVGRNTIKHGGGRDGVPIIIDACTEEATRRHLSIVRDHGVVSGMAD